MSPRSILKKLEAEYQALSEEESSESNLLPSKYAEDEEPRERKRRLWGVIHGAVIFVEVVLLAVLLLVSGITLTHQTRGASPEGARGTLDGLAGLGLYNTTVAFQNQSRLLKDSGEANDYWRDLLDSGGVVALDTEWALGQGLRPSHRSPTDASKSIYQIDVFHALHCLNAIRQNLVPENPPPWDEKHMLHCLDYIRHQLLCHPDLTLVTTRDLDEFVLDDAHTCRDYGAVADWVQRHRWVEFKDWLRNKTAGEG